MDAGADADAEIGCFPLEAVSGANRGHGAEEIRHQPVACAVDDPAALRCYGKFDDLPVVSEQVGPALVS
jgi:hypothetical protein